MPLAIGPCIVAGLCQFLLQFPISFRNLFIVLFSPAYFIYYIFSFCLNFSSFFIVFIFVFFLLRFSFCATAGLEMMPAELTEDSSSNTPNLVIIGISLAAFGFLLVNAALVAWFFVHQRRKKGSLTLHFMFISISFYKPFTLMFSLKIFYRLFEFITFSCLFSIIEHLMNIIKFVYLFTHLSQTRLSTSLI